MSYHLGIDLGTTYTAAAVARQDRVEVVGLGNRAASIPSVIYLRSDETILTGEAAERRAATEPGRIAREFKRRVGDPTPLLLGGSPYSAEVLTAKLLRWVVDKVAEQEGGPAAHLAVTHPANWGPYKQDLLRQAIRIADLPGATTLTEPEAAAISYAANERVEPGSLVAVYDLGGGTFDAAVLRKTTDSFAILGQPEGIERLGGIDLDAAVLAHVRRALGGALDSLDHDDPATISALARLRQECIEAKEALSSDTETTISVLLPTVQTEVRITRGEFEQLIRPPLTETVAAMRRALQSADVQPAEVSAVLLVGGSSRIPLVAELVSDAFGRPIAVDTHPKHAIALGAARAARLSTSGSTGATGVTTAPPAPASRGGGAGAAAGAAAAGAAAGVAGVAAAAHARASEPPPVPAAQAEAAATEALPPVPRSAPPTPPVVPPSAPAKPPRTPSPPPSAPAPTVAADPPDWERPAEPVQEGGRSKLPVLLGGGLGLLLIVVLAVVLLRGGDDPVVEQAGAVTPDAAPSDVEADPEPQPEPDRDDGADAVEQPPAQPDPEPEPEPEPAPDPGVAVPPGVDFATIDRISLDGSTYVVDFTTYLFEAALPGQHVHFFFDTVEPWQAGVPGDGPWFVYGGSSPFTGYGTADRPAGAGAMCVLVANPDHSVQADSGTCWPLP